jgi:hypothetical protein
VPFGVPSTRTARTGAARAAGHAPATAELAAVTAGAAVPTRRERSELWSEQTSVVVPALVVAATLIVVWLIAYPRTPDLAAQVYRVGLFRQLGFTVWDGNWYAGHHMPGYSLLFPALGSAIGLRAAGALCVLASTALFASLVAGECGRAARWGAAAFAVAAVGDIWLGRLAFALGVAIALGAALALRRGHLLGAVVLAALAAAASPVAGLLLGLAAATVAIVRRSPRPLLTLAAPAAAVVLPLAMLFPEGGYEPFPFLSFVVTVAVIAAFTAALPAEERLLRVGAAVYLAACVLCMLVHSPVGSNIERYGVLLGAPLLLCALLRERPAGSARAGIGLAGALALVAIGTWVLWGPVRETAAVDGSPATGAAYYRPVERFLDGLGGRPVRIEVPLTRSHWEAAMLAPHVALARGWEKQLDSRYDGVLLADGVSVRAYREWLDREAVAYVALPDAQPDPSSAAEDRLIRSGLPYLKPVFTSAHWRIFQVQGPTPLASGPGRLTALGHDKFALQARAAGTFLVREHFTRYWTVSAGNACVGHGPEGFTAVRARAPGRIVVAARFSVSRALGAGSSCHG